MKKEYFIEHRNNLKCSLHVNAELEIVYVIDGALSVETEGGRKTLLTSGEAMLILPYRVHSFTPYEGVNARVMMFSSPVTEQFCDGCRGFNFNGLKISVDGTLGEFCIYVLDRFKVCEDAFIIKSLFFAFASAFLEHKIEMNTEQTGVGCDITRVMEYVCANIGESLTLASTAKALMLSKNMLERVFVGYTGMTFAKFLHNMRVEKAITLLKVTDKTITEVAYECGFGSLRTFNRVFVAFVGVTPSAYRKNV